MIEQVFLDYFESQELPTQPTAFDGRSDYGPFIAQGIPAGGLFSGAEAEKTAEQVSLFGGVEGAQLDPCYHIACDTYDSVFAFPPELPQLDGNGRVARPDERCGRRRDLAFRHHPQAARRDREGEPPGPPTAVRAALPRAERAG